MNILLYGSKGWIGNQFKQILINMNLSFHEGQSRVDNEINVIDELKQIKPTHVISFVGRTHGTIDQKVYSTIDYLEQKGKLMDNVRDNLYGPFVLAKTCKEMKIHYTYLGTGCIFKFDEKHPFETEQNGFTEKSKPNFFGSSYSTVKGFTDRMMHMYNDSVLNLRIRMPITGKMEPRNFITKITTYEFICSIKNSMTVLPELLPKVVQLMQQNVTGTLNLTNPGLISHNEILEMFRDVVDPNFTWKNFSKQDQDKILASDRSNNFLDTTRLQSMFPDVKPIKKAIHDCLLEYKNSYVSKSKRVIYQPKNLLVTGGCGFIGSNFINHYVKQNKDVNVINIDAMYYCAKETNVDMSIRKSKHYTFIKGNLCSKDLVMHVLQHYKIDTVIHFAAQSHVQNSFTDSLQYTKDNILGTHTLLESCRIYGHIQRFICVSTDEVYGESMITNDEKKKTEQSILCPTNPYAATKAGAELIAQSYYHSFGFPIIITRGNNVYGPNQYPEKLIPKFIQQLQNNQKVTIQGSGKSLRSFLHSYDVARAFETILEKGNIGEIYNIGCDEGMEFSVMDVAKMLIEMIHDTKEYEQWISYIEDRPFNDMRYFINNDKLKKLGWEPTIGFREGLAQLI